MNPFVRKSMSTLVIQPSFRALGQMQVKWQTFEKPENNCHSAAFWPTALKLVCITNFDTLSLVMGFISLVNEIQFMPISSCHIWNRSIVYTDGDFILILGKRASVLAAKGTVDILLRVIVSGSKEGSTCEDILLLSHVILTKVGPKGMWLHNYTILALQWIPI